MRLPVLGQPALFQDLVFFIVVMNETFSKERFVNFIVKSVLALTHLRQVALTITYLEIPTLPALDCPRTLQLLPGLPTPCIGSKARLASSLARLLPVQRLYP